MNVNAKYPGKQSAITYEQRRLLRLFPDDYDVINGRFVNVNDMLRSGLRQNQRDVTANF